MEGGPKVDGTDRAGRGTTRDVAGDKGREVDPSTVRSWEQGLRTPSPLACRMLSEIEADPAHWRRRLVSCLAGPQTRGPAGA